MVEIPKADHCLRLVGISASLLPFILTIFLFLLHNEIKVYNTVFYFLFIGLTLSISLSIFAYIFKTIRKLFFYISLVTVFVIWITCLLLWLQISK